MKTGHAFVIGNGIYDHSTAFAELAYAVADAHDVFQLLTESPYAVFQPDSAGCHANLSLSEFEARLDDFLQQLQAGETAFIYFAGHAQAIGGKRLHLAMRDTDPSRLVRTGFAVEQLVSYFDERSIRSYVVVLDCCRAGLALQSPGVRQRGEEQDVGSISQLGGKGKVFVAAASGYGPAYELKELKHGLFTNYFLEGIESGRAVSSGSEWIGIDDICGYAQEQMARRHPTIQQELVQSGEDQSGKLIVARNPKYLPQSNEALTVLEERKQFLGVTSFSDQEKIRQAQLRLLREYLNVIAATGFSLDSLLPAVEMYGSAIGLGGSAIQVEVETYSASLRFSRPTAAREQAYAAVKGTAILASASSREPGMILRELRGSPFMYYLKDAIAGKAANEDGIVTLRNAYDYIRRNVQLQHPERISHPELHFPSQRGGNPEEFVLAAANMDWRSTGRRRRALLVGAERTRDASMAPLEFVEAQLREISRLLEEYSGFSCTILTGDAATQYSVLSELQNISQTATPEDEFCFLFSGHGLFSSSSGSSHYMLALSDTVADRPYTGLRLDNVAAATKYMRPAFLLVILDTSFGAAATASFQ